MNPNYPQVALRSLHRCEYCHAPESVFNFPFEVEHVVPLALGGVDNETNWALACRSCNVYKGTRVQCLDPETKIEVPLYHPRWEIWQEHFVVNTTTAEIIGLTPTGRATIVCLRINSQPQRLARQQWIRLGVFP
jgi:hypothetical protein